MGAKKTYVVKTDDEIIDQFKTLVAAKTLAARAVAEVFCDGELVYAGTAKQAQEVLETVLVHADPVVAETSEQSEVTEPATERYRLKTLMNVRKNPSLDADILSTKPESTVVHVLGIENGWLHLMDGSFILYENGKYAEKF